VLPTFRDRELGTNEPSADERGATFRIIDAAANRAAEGLRTLEDYARFAIEDGRLVADLKALRHGISQALAHLPRSELLAARSAGGDIGPAVTDRLRGHSSGAVGQSTAGLSTRADLVDVVVAAASRTQQALRSLEEYVGLHAPAIGQELERLRYQAYDLLAGLERRGRVAHRLSEVRLYVLVETGPDENAFGQHVSRLFDAGADLVQLRDKRASDRVLWRQAVAGQSAARQADRLFVVNDRADIALASRASGVHVGQDELPVAEVRKIVGGQVLVGLSTHRIADLEHAIKCGADYIGCGPTFSSTTKSFEKHAGLEYLREVVARGTALPAFAIGGIDETNLDDVLATGFRRIAVSGVVRNASDPYAVVRRLKDRIQAVSSASRDPRR
jgi:thiamine-phosphate pyrophosphorylase